MKRQRYRLVHIKWYVIGRNKKQGILIDPVAPKLGDNSPESFYHHEMHHSTLEERFLAHGGKLNHPTNERN